MLRTALRFWRHHFWYLTAFAAIFWLPMLVLEVTGVAHGIRIDVDHFDPGDVLLNVALVLIFEVLVTELLAAASEKIVANDLHGTALPTMREFVRSVPWASLVLGALVYEVGVAVGLALFVLPGVMVAVWGVVTGPVIVAEGSRALQAPRRSRDLVRGSFRTVAALVVLGFVVAELLASGTGEALGVFPHDAAEPLGEYVVHVLSTPLFGMATAVLYYALVGRERARTRDEPAGAGSS